MLLYFIIIPSATIAANSNSKNIHFINSYNTGHHWSDNIEMSFKNEIASKCSDYNIYVEYMDTQNFIYEEIKSSLNNILKVKRSNNEFNILAASGNNVSYLVIIKIAFVLLPIYSGLVLYFLFKLKRASLILRDSEEKLKTTFKSITDAVITTDIKGNITRINKRAEILTGWEERDAVGKKLTEIYYTINSDTDHEISFSIESILKDKNSRISDNLALISKNKKRYQISESVSPVYDNDGISRGVVLVFKDITAQYEVERRFKQAEREKKQILDNITVGICFMDKDMNIISINKEMAKHFKQKPEQLKGVKCHNARFHKDNVCNNCIAHESLLTGKVCKGEFHSTPEREYEMISVPIMKNGTPSEILVMVIDVTEYRKLQQDLHATNRNLITHSENLESIVKSRTEELNHKNKQLNDALLELKQTQSQLILSEKMTALAQLIAGIAHEINTPLGAINSSSENISHNIQYIIENLPAISYLLRAPESEVLSEMLKIAVNNKLNTPNLSTKENRAIRKRLEEELKSENISDYQNIARQLVDMNIYGQWGKFISVFNNNQGSKQLFELGHIVDIYSSCNTIRQAVGKASRIVNALKNYIKETEYKTEIIMKRPVNLKNSLQTVILLYQNKLKNTIELITDFEEVPEVLGISDELNQAWTNLLQNAIYALNDNGKITIRLYNYDNGVAIDIEDNGCGMTSDIQKRVFEPLFTTKPQGEGTGLGLDIARKIIEDNHNGTIDISSKINEGTRITVWLPIG